ncbi:uncharacterized protein LOC136764656 isoform X2 [Amia ocellicauda]
MKSVVAVIQLIFLFLLMGTGNASPHALVHMGALLSPSGPFLHSTLLDGLPVARCKPEKEILGPTQPWVSAALGTEDWERGDRMCREEKARFMETLLQLGDPPGVASVLQRRRGCVLEDDGRVTVFDDYGHNGEDLDNSSLTDSSPATGSVKDRRECVALLKKLLKHRKNRQVHPEVFVFVNKKKETQKPCFSCLATGIESKAPEVRLYKNGQEVTMGVWSSGVRPNGDDTYQLRKSVEITEEERHEYYCTVKQGTFSGIWRLDSGSGDQPHSQTQPQQTDPLSSPKTGHSLVHITTAFSRAGQRPYFSLSTLLDGVPVIWCDRDTETELPMQQWVTSAVQEWDGRDTVCREEKYVFRDLIKGLRNRTGGWVLQRRRGCVLEDDGRVTVFDDYGHNGQDLSILTISSPATGSVKDRRECVALLKKLLKDRKKRQVHPEVFVFVNKKKETQKPCFSCLATGIESKAPEVRLYKNGQEVTMGVWSSGVRPNGDDTYQLRKSVEITEEERHEYYCTVKQGTFSGIWRLDSGSGDQPHSQTQPQQTDPLSSPKTGHSLVHITTAFSRAGQRPYFSLSTLLDGVPVIWCDRDTETELPMQQWVTSAVQEWDGRDTVCREEKYVFRDLIKGLRNRTGGWVLQRRRGCVLEDDGRVTVFDDYGHNGQDLSILTISSPATGSVKDRRECVALLKKLLKDRKKRQVHPEVFVFVKKIKYTQKSYFYCLTTGFESEAPKVQLYRNRQQVTMWVWSSGVWSNGDGTFQLRMSMEITEEEGQEYHCSVVLGTFSGMRRLEPGSSSPPHSRAQPRQTGNQQHIRTKWHQNVEYTNLHVLMIVLFLGGGFACLICCLCPGLPTLPEANRRTDVPARQLHVNQRNVIKDLQHPIYRTPLCLPTQNFPTRQPDLNPCSLIHNNIPRPIKTTPLRPCKLTLVPAIEYEDDNSITFEETDQLGFGGFGKVYRGKYQGMTVTVKKIPDANTFFEQEILMCRNLSHPNIVRFIAAAKTERFVLLVYEYIHGADLHIVLKGDYLSIQLTREDKSHIALDLAMAVEYIHSKHIIHQDIKPANVMLEAKSKKAYLIDWGIAHVKDTIFVMGGRIVLRLQGGTPYYMAPECLLTQSEATLQSDVWSLGITFIQLYTNELPWGTNNLQVMPLLMQLKRPPPGLGRLSQTDRKVIEPMLRYTPAARLSAEEVVQSLRS